MKNWKEHLETLCDQLPAVGIDPKELRNAMKPLPTEYLTSKTYMQLSSRARQGIATISTGLMFLDRDLETLSRVGQVSEIWNGIHLEVKDVLMPLYKNACKSFYKWEKKSYPHGNG